MRTSSPSQCLSCLCEKDLPERAERRRLRSSRVSDGERTRERGTLRTLYQGAIAEFRGSSRQRRPELPFLLTLRCFKEPRHAPASSRLDSSPGLSLPVVLHTFSPEDSSGREPAKPLLRAAAEISSLDEMPHFASGGAPMPQVVFSTKIPLVVSSTSNGGGRASLWRQQGTPSEATEIRSRFLLAVPFVLLPRSTL
ncbi:UNVERIFIED_CONTAM: hypothetical protein HHA_229800 [Hammondia hammondi]|eukprot:XP_008889555.1 hypothetical protein HHA_229800 [Hammondia hammondi]